MTRRETWCHVAAALFATLVTAPPAIAQDAAMPLTVGEAIDRALARSARLAEAEAREAAARSRQAAERPLVSVSGGYTRTNHVDEFGVPQPNGTLRVIYPDIPDNFFTRGSLQWPIYTGGRSDALIRAAAAEARAAGADLAAARADLRLEVTRAYWALVTASESVRVLQEGVARADAHLRDVRSRFDNGLVPPNDVASAEAQRARHELHLIEARNLRSGVMEDLRRLTGIDGDVAPVDALDGGGAAAGSAPPARRRPELDALAHRIAAAEERVAAIQAARRPALSFTGAVEYANPNPRIFPRADLWRTSWELGVAGTWTLWDGGRSAADVSEAAAGARALRAREADAQSLISTEIRQRELDVHSTRAALAASTAAVTSAAEARRVIGERFAVGVATSTEVLDAQMALLQAELDRTRALAGIRLAEARLSRALGH
jgi:outer membrane protein